MEGPFEDFPQITVYHPTDGHPFANVGWAGISFSLGGHSSSDLAVSHIGVSFPDSTFGRSSRFGVPFEYLLRDILQFDNSIDDALTRITNANRTCDLILGVGDGIHNEFRAIEYSASVANIFDDTDMQPTADWHPLMEDVVYYGMDWLCPNYDIVMDNQLTYAWGQLTPELSIQNVTSYLQSGSNWVSVYDLTPASQQMYVSFAGGSNSTYPFQPAYDRQFTKLDMQSIYAVGPPTSSQIEATKAFHYRNPNSSFKGRNKAK